MKNKTIKFGGTSLSDPTNINLVVNIIKNDKKRKYVVVSAPGKRFKEDEKITDLLYLCYKEYTEKRDYKKTLQNIKKRFAFIAHELNLSADMNNYFDIIEKDIISGKNRDYLASRGEYLMAIILAESLGFKFVDAKDIIRLNENGVIELEETKNLIKENLSDYKKGYVIPGFYGAKPDGEIKTFSRGGSDYSGSLVAGAMNCFVYENFTDVDGFLASDPRIVKDPILIKSLTYKELRELSYMGANVLHPDCVFPLYDNQIPINIKNTFYPEREGTMIVSNNSANENPVTGIIGKKNYVKLILQKTMLNNKLEFAHKLLGILLKYNISLEFFPINIDDVSVILTRENFDENEENLMDDIRNILNPASLKVEKEISIIALVGQNINKNKELTKKLFTIISEMGIDLKMIKYGSSKSNILIGVSDDIFEETIKEIYRSFFG